MANITGHALVMLFYDKVEVTGHASAMLLYNMVEVTGHAPAILYIPFRFTTFDTGQKQGKTNKSDLFCYCERETTVRMSFPL